MGFTKAIKVLSEYASFDGRDIISQVGDELVNNLRSATPVDTGETANSWGKEVTSTNGVAEVVIYNNAHSNCPIPVPLLIKYGHGTGNGGYVPPNDFITAPFNEAVSKLSTLIDGEVS